jgi:hypothetical protein
MDTVNEGSDTVLTIGCTSPDGTPVTPSNVSYIIMDYFTGNVLVESLTNVPTSDSFDIDLTAQANTIINQYYAYELRQVFVSYTYSGTKTKTDQYEYQVINMAGVPIPGDDNDTSD